MLDSDQSYGKKKRRSKRKQSKGIRGAGGQGGHRMWYPRMWGKLHREETGAQSEEGEGEGPAEVWGEDSAGRGNGPSKNPEARECLVCSRRSKKTPVCLQQSEQGKGEATESER